jgi:peptidoglycan hydrolase-like protein with peptidoglycan-binding domain
VAVALVVVIVVVATGGGSKPAVTELTPTTTLPAVTPTTTPTATTTTPPTTTTKPAVRVTVPVGGNLSTGDSGARVLALQKALASLGYDPGTPDGDFGTGTEAAVIAFQKANGLTPDGIVGAKTAQAINDALANA